MSAATSLWRVAEVANARSLAVGCCAFCAALAADRRGRRRDLLEAMLDQRPWGQSQLFCFNDESSPSHVPMQLSDSRAKVAILRQTGSSVSRASPALLKSPLTSISSTLHIFTRQHHHPLDRSAITHHPSIWLRPPSEFPWVRTSPHEARVFRLASQHLRIHHVAGTAGSVHRRR